MPRDTSDLTAVRYRTTTVEGLSTRIPSSSVLTRPGMVDIQLDLFHDYRTNVASYPKWQAYLRGVRPPTLVLWGKHDLSFTVAGAVGYGDDVPEAEVHLLDAGHVALDEAAPQIAALIRGFFAVRALGAGRSPE
jgi:pimeloyl-ACP methyl ester carboxylesterase